jgi:hypothetical protein
MSFAASSSPIIPRRSLISRVFNVLHYGTVAVLMGSSVFLVVNVIGAARAKKKAFRAEQIAGKLAAMKENEENDVNDGTSK